MSPSTKIDMLGNWLTVGILAQCGIDPPAGVRRQRNQKPGPGQGSFGLRQGDGQGRSHNPRDRYYDETNQRTSGKEFTMQVQGSTFVISGGACRFKAPQQPSA